MVVDYRRRFYIIGSEQGKFSFAYVQPFLFAKEQVKIKPLL